MHISTVCPLTCVRTYPHVSAHVRPQEAASQAKIKRMMTLMDSMTARALALCAAHGTHSYDMCACARLRGCICDALRCAEVQGRTPRLRFAVHLLRAAAI